MSKHLKVLLVFVCMVSLLGACKKAEEESAQIGTEAAEEIKSDLNTAKEEAEDAVQAAKDAAASEANN